MLLQAFIFLLIVLASVFSFSPRLIHAADGCVTAQCHPKLLQARHVHPAAEPCDTCHQAVLSPHPQKKKQTFKLAQDVPGLCSQCHPALGTMKNVHSPVKNGMCTACHDPHASSEPKLLAQPAQDLCAGCHGEMTKHRYVHGPAAVGDCISCHDPHESNLSALARKEGGELCFTCHLELQAIFKKKFVHSAMSGGCTSCHNPHGGNTKKFLAADGEKLCFQCHPGVEEKFPKARTVHNPVKTEKGCASCHTPHASDGEKLLSKSGKDLCLDCHRQLMPKDQAVLHGPIRDGKCTPCHDPHASPNAKLLVRDFSSEFYIPYTDKEYNLCFACHKRDLLKYPTTSFATGFRDGERNLHYLHVNISDKGRSCRACHQIHGGGLAKLITDKAVFGKWSLPLRFVKTETGGSCAPGCHQKVNYDRKTPGKAPEPERPKSDRSIQAKRP